MLALPVNRLRYFAKQKPLPMPKFLPLTFVTAVIVFAGCTQKPAEPVFVGLKVLKLYDSSRTFDTTKQSKNIHRPVKIDMFYPSPEKPATAPLTYGDILDMYEQRFAFDTPIDSCKKTTRMFGKMFGDALHINPYTKMLDYKLSIYKNLAVSNGKHPLIIYAAGMNGSSWDNPVLFDSLASNGYVVASVSSVGLYPGYMSGAVDIDEQVKDILYTIKQMKALPYVDVNKIGIVSWSLGGTAAIKAALLSKDIKAIISYDGTDLHAYGPDKDWDKEYNEIRSIAPANVKDITVPYMYLRSEHPSKIDSLYSSLALASSKEKFFLKLGDAVHEDFSSMPLIANHVEPMRKNDHAEYHAAINRLTLIFFDEYVKGDNNKNTHNYIDELVKMDSAVYKKEMPVY